MVSVLLTSPEGDRGAGMLGVDPVGDRLGGVGVEIGDHHFCSGTGQRYGERLTDAVTSSGDDRDSFGDLHGQRPRSSAGDPADLS